MLSLRDIYIAADASSYNRGKLIYETGGVIRCSASLYHDARYIALEAEVKGSNRRNYYVEVVLDSSSGTVSDGFCQCEEFGATEGICRHCVAALLEYKNHNGGSDTWERSSGKTRATDEDFMRLMTHYARRDKTRFLLGAARGQVELEPIVELSAYHRQVGFRLGTDRKYILRNIGDFVRALEEGKRIEYGKRLAFVHHMDAFKEDSKPLVEFLRREVSGRSGGSHYYGSYKELLLERDNMDRFMGAVGERSFEGRIEGFREEYWQIRDGDINVSGDLTREGDGYRLWLSRMAFWEGRSFLYFPEEGGIIRRVPADQAGELREVLDRLKARDQEYYIAEEEMPLLVREMLPLLDRHGRIRRENMELEQYLPEQAAFDFYLDTPQKDMVSCKVHVRYGDETFNIFDPIDLTQKRDADRELYVGEVVKSFFQAFSQEDRSLVIQGDEEALYDLLSQGLEMFAGLGSVYLSEDMKKLQVRPSFQVSMGVSVADGILTVDFQGEDMDLDLLAQVLSRYDRRKRYFRLKDGSFLKMEESMDQLADMKEALDLRAEDVRKGSIRLPAFRALYLENALREGSSIEAHREKSFKALIRNMKTVEENDFELPDGLGTGLREYQKAGYMWIRTLHGNGFGGILADDMGLGKTLQVITFLLALYEEKKPCKTLIVTPASLVYNWQKELERFAPSLPVRVLAGTQEQRWKVLEEEAAGGENEVWVTSYDLLKRDIDQYEKWKFDIQVIDEAQFIKNANTQAATAVKQIQSAFRLALTGTPMENRLSELWSIFDFLMPGFLYSYSRFKTELEQPIAAGGDERSLRRLQKMLHPFVLRRLKQDVLKDLPDKLEENLFALMEGEQRQLYDAHVQRFRLFLDKYTDEELAGSRIQLLSELTRLRQICCSPGLIYEGYGGGSAKLDLGMEYIRNAVEGGHKILLFSQFTSVLEMVEGRLKAEGISYYVLTGQTPKTARMEMVESFNRDETSIFLISLKAGGTGLNLTSADVVIHFDPWWNVAVQNQATDRAHRIGQKKVVTVYKLIASDSIEERILQMQEKKEELASQILSGDGADTMRFSREDLLELLG